MTVITAPPANLWRLLREAAGISQAEAERRMGWKRGRLSVIERGLYPLPPEEIDLRRLYRELVLRVDG